MKLEVLFFSSCRELRWCASPLESELAACSEGISLATQWSELPFVIQTDCAEVVKLIEGGIGDRWEDMMFIRNITSRLWEHSEVLVKLVRHEQNAVSHFLANFGRIKKRTAVWLHSEPDRFRTYVMQTWLPFN